MPIRDEISPSNLDELNSVTRNNNSPGLRDGISSLSRHVGGGAASRAEGCRWKGPGKQLLPSPFPRSWNVGTRWGRGASWRCLEEEKAPGSRWVQACARMRPNLGPDSSLPLTTETLSCEGLRKAGWVKKSGGGKRYLPGRGNRVMYCWREAGKVDKGVIWQGACFAA